MKDSERDFELRSFFGNFDANLEFLCRSGILKLGMKLLEIGSGTGGLLQALRRMNYDIQGVEINPEVIARGRALYGSLPLIRVWSEKLPFKASLFDAVLSFDVFEHIPDSDSHLREVHRVLKPKGVYLLQTPNKYTNALFETIRWKSTTRWKKDHCSLHTRGELIRRFDRNGFKAIFVDNPVTNRFFTEKVAYYLGPLGPMMLRLVNPDHWPNTLKTGFYVKAIKQDIMDKK